MMRAAPGLIALLVFAMIIGWLAGGLARILTWEQVAALLAGR
jgi:hypothetical protein